MDPINNFYVICSWSWTFCETYYVLWLGFDIKTNGLKFQVIIVTMMSEKMILKTGPAIGQSSVLGYNASCCLTRLRLSLYVVAEARAVLVDIMGRQVMPGVKWKYIVSCEQM